MRAYKIKKVYYCSNIEIGDKGILLIWDEHIQSLKIPNRAEYVKITLTLTLNPPIILALNLTLSRLH